MEAFIFDKTTVDGIPLAVCGICRDGSGNNIRNALKAIGETEFGNYKSGFTIDYRLAEILKTVLLPFGSEIYYAGATVSVVNAECVTGGVFGSILTSFSSAEEGIKYENGFTIGMRPGGMAFAVYGRCAEAERAFNKTACELYDALMDTGREFMLISDGSGKSLGIAATKDDFITLEETRQRAAEQTEFFGLKKIGVMGGTFDPVHNGHLIAAEAVRERLGLDKVIFVPTGITPYKRGMTASGSHRYKMTCQAVKSNKYFCVSSMETEYDKMAYTVDTIARLREQCDRDAEIYFIMGADVLEDIMRWKGFDRLAKLCQFAAVTRPGYNGYGLTAVGRLRDSGAEVHFVEAPALDISSSNIRRAVREGRSIKYLMPEEVEKFIRLHRLYKNDKAGEIEAKLFPVKKGCN